MNKACLKAWVLVLPVLLTAGSAAAQTATRTRILVLDPQSKFLEAKQLVDLGLQLRSLAAKYPSLKVLKTSEKGLAGLHKKAGCTGFDAKCLALVGQQAKAERVLHSQIQRLPGRYLLVMTLVDAGESRIIEQSRKRARGGPEALRSALLKSWVDVVGPLFRSKLKIRANIAGAEVFLDGQNIGKTPLVLTKNMGKGKHVIEVAHQDYEPVRREIVIEKGRDLEIEVNLKKKPRAKPEVVAAATAAAKPKPLPPIPPPPEPPPEAKGEPQKQPKPAPRPEPEPQPKPKPKPIVGTKIKDVSPDKPAPAPFLPSMNQPAKETGEPEATTRVAGAPIYKQWWFWTVVGVVVAGGTTGLILGLSGDEPGGIPAGKGRVTIEF